LESKILKAVGIDPGILIIILFIFILVLIGLYLQINMQYKRLKSSYNYFMKGEDGKSLEKSMKARYAEVGKVIDAVRKNHVDIQMIKEKTAISFQKVGIEKYDAFNEMGGKLSFALTMLNDRNDGWIINVMHSREGCYAYIKEIVKGESHVELASEEKKSLSAALYNDVLKVK
jgi:uncharacterized protein YxeA